MVRKSAIIIGAGAAGLACGSYLRMNGYETAVYERCAMAGGVCVAWKRKGYLFDGATNWLPGSAPSVNFNAIWKELIDFSEMPLIDFDEFLKLELANGAALHVYTDALKLRQEMLSLAPEDHSRIMEFTNAVMTASRLQLPVLKPPALFNAFDLAKLAATSLPLGLFFSRWKPCSIEQYAAGFKNENLRALFKLIFMRHEFFSVMGLIMSLGWMHARSAGYPLGGSNHLIGLLEKRYNGLGGTLTCGMGVQKIIVETSRCAGVVLDNGKEHRADLVVSACDGHATFEKLLGGKFTPQAYVKAFASERIFPSMIQVSLGIGRLFPEATHKMTIPFVNPVCAGSDNGMSHMMVRFTGFDPCFAPAGKTAVVVHLRTTDYAYWENLRATAPDDYKKEKERMCESVIDTLETRFGNVRALVETTDVTTPATWIRYTGNWKGSYQGWAPTPRVVGSTFPKTAPGLRDFYMTGQWVEPPGGLPRVIISARQAVQIICHDDHKPFSTTTPES